MNMLKMILAALLVFITVGASASEWQGHASMLFSQKYLDDEWDGHDSQSSGAIMIDFKKPSWPVSFAVDAVGSHEDSVSGNLDETGTGELDIGIRKIWEISGSDIQPYVGGGLALMSAEQRRLGLAKQDDDVVGAWLGAGAYWNLGERLQVGLDVRYSRGEVTLYDEDVDAGGVNAGAFIGIHW
ncbi:outer membrane protein [Sedimenticola sp.]|uniref:outer membrane protein n=1 Tax=Sedimenticola sp. TaxID=1940285 RepID=UPI003D0F7FFA